MADDRWDEYFIPGTQVLRNKFVDLTHPHGTTDSAELERLSTVISIAAMSELYLHDYPARTYQDMKAIHRAIFRDIYPFAGEERFAPVGRPMRKRGPDVVDHPRDPRAVRVYEYLPAQDIAAAATDAYARLADDDYLSGLSLPDFVAGLAEHWGRINVIHAFREGNTRSQFVFFTKLTRAAGFDVNPHMYGPGQPLRQQFVDARFYHQATGDASRLRAALAPAVTIPSPGSRPDRSLRDLLHRALSEEPPAAAPVYRRGEDPEPPTAHQPSIEGE